MDSVPRRSPATRDDAYAAAKAQTRTTLVSIAAASLLVILKLGTGLVAGSLGLVSAGVESSGDVIAAAFTFFAVRIGLRPADRDHPYGHRRAENLGALAEAAILIAGGMFVSFEAIRHLVRGGATPDTGWYVFAVIAAALVIDVSRTLASVRAARRFSSAALGSNAYHFAADMAGSIAVLCGLIAARAGFPRGDAVAALIVAALVFAAAFHLIAVNARALMDTAPSDASAAAEQAVSALAPDIQLRRLRMRESAGRFFADAVVTVPPGLAVVEGHLAADAVEAAVTGALPGSDVVVHVEPRQRGLDLRDKILAAALSEPLVREAHDITIFEGADGCYVSLHLKFPADLTVQEAHEVAERVESAIEGEATVAAAQTHLEPLERPVQLTGADPDPGGVEAIKDLAGSH